VLQEKVVEPVGSERPKEADVRLIAATNASLEERVAAGKFRDDLYYRLKVVPISVPSLRERTGDIALLAEAFVKQAAKGENLTIDPDLLRKLEGYHWPGNVRELLNLVERMVLLRRSNVLTADDLPGDFGTFDPRPHETTPVESEQLTFHDAERKLVLNALNKCGWNKSKAAKLLKVPRHVLLYRIKKYGLEEERA
jgi:two-component system NtrC family response regulator